MERLICTNNGLKSFVVVRYYGSVIIAQWSYLLGW